MDRWNMTYFTWHEPIAEVSERATSNNSAWEIGKTLQSFWKLSWRPLYPYPECPSNEFVFLYVWTTNFHLVDHANSQMASTCTFLTGVLTSIILKYHSNYKVMVQNYIYQLHVPDMTEWDPEDNARYFNNLIHLYNKYTYTVNTVNRKSLISINDFDTF
jgi:hypothetical protein